MTNSDLTLAIRRAPADESAWEAWFKEVYPKVLYLTAKRSSGDVELAEEATQGAIERFLRYGAYERVDSDRRVIAYLVQTATRLMADEARRRAREVLIAADALAERVAVAHDWDDDLESLFARIPEAERRILRMALDGHSIQEIAKELGLGYSATAMRIHRAKARLRKSVLRE